MSSAQIALPQGVWTQITTTDKQGSIRHHQGGSKVIYIEAPVIPVGFDPSSPTMETTIKGEGWPYYGVAATDFVWAYSITDDSIIVVSPAEV